MYSHELKVLDHTDIPNINVGTERIDSAQSYGGLMGTGTFEIDAATMDTLSHQDVSDAPISLLWGAGKANLIGMLLSHIGRSWIDDCTNISQPFVIGTADVGTASTRNIWITEAPFEGEAEAKIRRQLMEYIELPVGWDGYDAVPAKPGAVYEALNFLATKPRDIEYPYPQLSSDGEVGFYWRTDEVFADIGFYGDGKYSCYARYMPKKEMPTEFMKDGLSVSAHNWPIELLLILGKITS